MRNTLTPCLTAANYHPRTYMNAKPKSPNAGCVRRLVRRLVAGQGRKRDVDEHYDSEEIAYCKCGEQINIVRGSDRTCNTDKTRLRYPDDTEGWCVFRCRNCGEVADPKPKPPNEKS
jgi:hypothetical protein